jgi:hypothetical protein
MAFVTVSSAGVGYCAQTWWSSIILGSWRSPNDAAEGLYRLVGAAYEKRSVALSSNLHTRPRSTS